jgi:hypothetical protein
MLEPNRAILPLHHPCPRTKSRTPHRSVRRASRNGPPRFVLSPQPEKSNRTTPKPAEHIISPSAAYLLLSLWLRSPWQQTRAGAGTRSGKWSKQAILVPATGTSTRKTSGILPRPQSWPSHEHGFSAKVPCEFAHLFRGSALQTRYLAGFVLLGAACNHDGGYDRGYEPLPPQDLKVHRVPRGNNDQDDGARLFASSPTRTGVREAPPILRAPNRRRRESWSASM